MAVTEPLPIIWTAGAIGRYLRLGADGVYALAREPGTPIRRSRGRLFAFEDELAEWMRRPENQANLEKPKRA